MRILILLIVIVVALVIVQHERNDCQWGESGWMECVLTFDGTPATTTPATDTEEPNVAP